MPALLSCASIFSSESKSQPPLEVLIMAPTLRSDRRMAFESTYQYRKAGVGSVSEITSSSKFWRRPAPGRFLVCRFNGAGATPSPTARQNRQQFETLLTHLGF